MKKVDIKIKRDNHGNVVGVKVESNVYVKVNVNKKQPDYNTCSLEDYIMGMIGDINKKWI